nr:disks large homolog 5-like isoform X2 [Zootoca vivipara]XP_034994545.1 disks large homolog 5-like isoform X2 [Zootoca vivipara]XP_034994546.1 disks large homolog 5-like isoform X2 [Zootoca vivipara]
MGLSLSLRRGGTKATVTCSDRGKSVHFFDEETQQGLDPQCVHGLHPPAQPAEQTSTQLCRKAGSATRPSGTTDKPSSPPPAVTNVRQMNEKPETLLFQPCQEQDELRKRLALSSPGSTFDDCSTLHSCPLSDQSQLKEDMDNLKQKNNQLVRERDHLQQLCEEMKKLHDEDLKEITDLHSQLQQVMKQNGSSETLNKLYNKAMGKLEGVKKDYDALRKRYNEKMASYNTDLSRLEQKEGENRRLQKQIDKLNRRFETVQQELSKATAQNKELQREMERLQAEVTRFKTVQLKAVKDAEKYKEERDAVFNEYCLIMSERDEVLNEMDRLDTELELAESKLKNMSSKKRVASEEMEALRQKLNSVKEERDVARK